MKMTMHIDEELLDSVMSYLGVTNKTLAVELALKEMHRKAKLMSFGAKKSSLTPDEIRGIFDPGYDLEAMRAAERPGRKYGKANSRR